jgi:hypothetical protein
MGPVAEKGSQINFCPEEMSWMLPHTSEPSERLQESTARFRHLGENTGKVGQYYVGNFLFGAHLQRGNFLVRGNLAFGIRKDCGFDIYDLQMMCQRTAWPKIYLVPCMRRYIQRPQLLCQFTVRKSSVGYLGTNFQKLSWGYVLLSFSPEFRQGQAIWLNKVCARPGNY